MRGATLSHPLVKLIVYVTSEGGVKSLLGWNWGMSSTGEESESEE